MLNILNAKFDKTVTIKEGEVCFDNCEFSVKGANKKDQTTPALKIEGTAKVIVKNSLFESQGYQAVSINTSNEVILENNVFNCANNYNPIEGTVSAKGTPVGNVVIKNNEFNGICGNNYINFYNMKDGSIVTLDGNNFNTVSRDSEILRLSNSANTSATFNVKDNSYIFTSGEVGLYTAFMLCQDFTKKNGVPQDFSKYVINIENLECNGVKATLDKVAEGKLFVVYEDGVGLIEDNAPVINIK